MAISVTIPTWIQEVSNSYGGDTYAAALISEVTVATQGPHIYHYTPGVLRKNGKIYIGDHGPLRQQLLTTFHDSPIRGHSG